MTSYTVNLLTTPGRDMRTNASRATLIAAAQRRLEALRSAGLPTGHAEHALAKLEGELPCQS